MEEQMNSITFHPIPTATVAKLQNGGLDANGQHPEHHVSDGVPCRHCLTEIPAGEPSLILAYRPFPNVQPYAEMGPIFLHAEACPAYVKLDKIPAMFLTWEKLLIRGYSKENRIVYGSGQVVPTETMAEEASRLLAKPEIAYVHVRSASNNCYQCRIERGE